MGDKRRKKKGRPRTGRHLHASSRAGAQLVSGRPVRVRINDRSVPCTDGQEISLPDPRREGQVNRLALEHHRANLAHEAGHVRYTDMEAYRALAPYCQRVFNCLEDIRVETLVAAELRGYGADLGRAALRHARSLAALIPAGSLPPDEEVLVGLLVRYATGSWPALGSEARELRARVDPELERLEALRHEPDLTASRELAEIARTIVERWGEPPEVPAARLSLHEVLDPAADTEAERLYGDDRSADVARYAACTDTDHVGPCEETDAKTAREDLEAIGPHLAAVRRVLRRSLSARARPRTIGERRRGERLDSRALWRLPALGETRVFEQRVPGTRPDTALVLLVDESGSMRGQRIVVARRAALLLATGLEGLGIPVAVVGHSTREALPIDGSDLTLLKKRLQAGFSRCDSLLVNVYKAADEPLHRARRKMGAMRQRNHNVDGEALVHAAELLARRREAHRLLVVLSDGEPECSFCPQQLLVDHLRRAVAALRKAGILVAGLGIQSASVQQLYPGWAVVTELADLAPALVALAGRALANAPDRKVR